MSNALPPPPDGAPLADLDERRAWLSRVEVAYALPREGMLWAPDGFDGQVVRADGVSVRATAPDGAEREEPLTASAAASLEAAWTEAWRSPREDAVTLLLHYRGLFRTVGPSGAAPLEAWLVGVLRS